MKEQVVLPACYWTVSPRALDVRLAPEANGSAGSPWTVSPLVPLPLGSVSKHLPTGALRKPPLTCFSSTLVCNGSPSPFTSSILVSIKPLTSLFPLAIGHSLSSGTTLSPGRLLAETTSLDLRHRIVLASSARPTPSPKGVSLEHRTESPRPESGERTTKGELLCQAHETPSTAWPVAVISLSHLCSSQTTH